MQWQWYAFGSAFCAGLTAIFGKLGVAGINSNLATLIRTAIILVMTAIIVAARGEWQMPRGMEPRPFVFLFLSAIATGASWLCYYRALQLAPASLVAPIDKLSVVFAIVLAAIFLGEVLTVKVMFGATLIVLGAVVLAWP